MQLKQYHERVVNEVRVYLDALANELADGHARHAGKDAWEACDVPRPYRSERRNGINLDLPTFRIKVPTGGGKTLLATQILGLIHKTILKNRRSAEIHKLADKHYRKSDRADDAIRPIVLVQVERTGKDQREARFVHSEDVKEHLMRRLGVDERKIARVFEEVGHEVTWQKLGEDFENHEFRFQVLDEGEYAHRDWDEDLNKLLTRC